MLELNSPKPLYEQLETIIKHDISSGKYAPGQKMPSEAELCETYEVSRITVRRALQNLCDQKMLERKQGKGTFVANHKHKTMLNNSVVGFTEALERSGHIAKHTIIEKKYIQADAENAEKLQVNEGTLLVYVRRLLYDNGLPFAIDEITFDSSQFPTIMDKMNGDISFYALLKEGYNVNFSHSNLELNMKQADTEESSLLQYIVGEPLFDIFKIAYDDHGRPIHLARSYVRADRVTYVIRTNKNETEIHFNTKE